MPTRQGWTTLFAAFAAITIGRLFGLIELYVVAAGLGAALAIAVAIVRFGGRPHFRVAREVRPDVVSVGDEAEVHLRLANRGHRTTPAVQLWDQVGSVGGAAMRLAPLHAQEEAAASYRLQAARRGVLPLGPLRVERRDLFGLARTAFDGAPEVAIVVVPWHQPIAPPAGTGGAGIINDIVRIRSLASAAGEFRGLRDYVAGDDLRRVHWKASARSDELKVREVDASGIRRCMVVLDRSADQYEEASFERAVSVAASITLAAATTMPTRLYGGSDLDVRGPDAGFTALRALAPIERAPYHDLDAVTVPASDGFGLVVLVTGAAGSRAEHAVRAHANPTEIIVVVACSMPPPPQQRLVIDATSWADFLTGWTAVAGAAPALAGALA